VAVAIVILGAIAFAACLVFITLRWKKSTEGPSQIGPSVDKKVRTPKKFHLHVYDDHQSPKTYLIAHPILEGESLKVEIAHLDDGAGFLRELEEKFPGTLPQIALSLSNVRDLHLLRTCPEFISYITSVHVDPDLCSGDNAQLLARTILSFGALHEIFVETMARVDVDEAILNAIGIHPTLRKVTLAGAKDIRLESMGRNVHSLFLDRCVNVDASSVLPGRIWKEIALGDVNPFPNGTLPGKIITQKLETSMKTIFRDPGFLAHFGGMHSLVLGVDYSEKDGDAHGDFSHLLQCDHLSEITIRGWHPCEPPRGLLETIKKMSQLKKFIILRTIGWCYKSPEKTIAQPIRDMLMTANPSLEIEEKDAFPSGVPEPWYNKV
jgi:hypothetical protein